MKSFHIAFCFWALAVSSAFAQSNWTQGLEDLPVFDAEYYAEQNDGVDAESALEHWKTKGLISGASGSAVFDPSYYIQKNPDIVKQLDNPKDYVGAAIHWLDYGIQAGRPSHPDFDIKYYVKNNQELYKTYGLDFRKLIDHYLREGKAKGLQASP